MKNMRNIISFRGIIATGLCILALAGALQLSYAGDAGESGKKPKKEPTTKPALTKEEETKIKKHVFDYVRSQYKENNYCDVSPLKHLVGDYYIAKAGYAKGNDWHLYLTNGKDIQQAGKLLGESGIGSCLFLLAKHEGWPKKDKDYRGLVKKAIESLSDDYGVIVGKNAEIPKYDKAPLADDLNAVIRPMWSYQTKDFRGQATIHYVTYSYQQEGGQVFRHRFSFTPDTKQTVANTVRLVTKIGDTLYRK